MENTRIRIWAISLALSITLFSAVVWAVFTLAVKTVSLDPNSIFTQTRTDLFVSAQFTSDAKHQPTAARLLRLQADGKLKEVSSMWDDGTHGDFRQGDGIYSCVYSVKEPTAGMLAFGVEAVYPGNAVSVRSQPLFVKIIGVASKKNKKEVIQFQEQAKEKLQQLIKEKGPDAAKNEMMLWLPEQPLVNQVHSAPHQNIDIEYRVGVTQTLHMDEPLPTKK